MLTGSISGNVRFICLRTLRPIVKIQWTVLLIPQVLDNFITKLCDAIEKNKHSGQDPVFFRGDPDFEEFIIDGYEGEQLGTFQM